MYIQIITKITQNFDLIALLAKSFFFLHWNITYLWKPHVFEGVDLFFSGRHFQIWRKNLFQWYLGLKLAYKWLNFTNWVYDDLSTARFLDKNSTKLGKVNQISWHKRLFIESKQYWTCLDSKRWRLNSRLFQYLYFTSLVAV